MLGDLIGNQLAALIDFHNVNPGDMKNLDKLAPYALEVDMKRVAMEMAATPSHEGMVHETTVDHISIVKGNESLPQPKHTTHNCNVDTTISSEYVERQETKKHSKKIGMAIWDAWDHKNL